MALCCTALWRAGGLFHFFFMTKKGKKNWYDDFWMCCFIWLRARMTDSLKKKQKPKNQKPPNCIRLSYGEAIHSLLNDKQGLSGDHRADGRFASTFLWLIWYSDLFQRLQCFKGCPQIAHLRVSIRGGAFCRWRKVWLRWETEVDELIINLFKRQGRPGHCDAESVVLQLPVKLHTSASGARIKII